MSARPTPPREPLYWPLTAPGMPNPGPDFVAHAAALGDDETTPGKKARDRFERVGRGLAGLYARALRQPGFALPVKLGPGRSEPLGFVVGHLWGQHQAAWALHQTHPDAPPPPPVDGPHPADVMLVGKMPGAEEEKHRRCLTGPSGELLLAELARARAPDPAGYYVTNLLKFRPPQKADRIAAGWLADCLPLLHMELRLVRPKVILCVGADAAKALLGPKATVREMDGVVRELTFPVGVTADDPATHTALVMAVVHPAEVLRDKSRERQFARGIARFALLASGVRWDLGVEVVDHRVVDSLAAAEAWAAEAEAELAALPPADRLVAWDAEWHGSHPVNRGSYLRTVQLSWADKKAVVFRLTGPGGVPAFAGASGRPTRKAVGELVGLLNRFMAGKRAVGHFLVADLEWLHHYGFRPTDPCPVPLDPLPDGTPAWARLRAGEGWLDTGLLFHAVEETAQLGLDALSVRYTDAPRYDLPLERWKEQYCADHKLDKGKLEGFGDCPDSVLVGEVGADGVTLANSYAAFDADVTRRLAVLGRPLLDSDYDGNCCWEPFWAAMLTCRPILQMHVNGIAVDRDRLDRLTDVFLTAREAQVEKLRDAARWPELNPRSILQVRELVFGVRHGKKDPDTGAAVVQRPDGAISLDLPPALDTGKPQRAWAELERKGLDRDATPSTNKTAVGLLLADHGDDPAVREVLTLLRDYRYLDQALKTVLYDPLAGEDGGRLTDEDGHYEYEKGIASALDDDGRVRTHLYPTTETRRWRSARPNLQNMCLLPNVEVLTRAGWVRLADLVADAAVAQYDPAGGRVAFAVPSAHVRQDFAGDLVRVEGFDFAQTVTPDHRLLVRPAGATVAAETTAAALLAVGGGGDVPLCGELAVPESPAAAADHPALVGFLAAHSQVVAVKGRAWVRLAVRDREAARLVQAALDARGVPHRWTHYRRGGSVDVPVAHAVDLLGTYGEDWDAALARWWGGVWDRHPDALRDLLDRVLAAALIVGPGEYRFKTRAAADRVQALAVVVRRPCVVRHTGTARDPWGVKFVAPAGWGRVRKVTPEAYAGPVHCLTVPSGYFLVRQAGRVSVTGNSKARDDDYKKLLGAAYTDKIRSMFVASPGFVLVEADYKGAELFVAAVLAGDHQMIDHARRANFPDEGYDAAGRPDPKGKSPHPEYYDIHSNVAVLAFRLTVSDHKYQDDPKHPHFGKTAAEVLGLPVGAPCPPNKFALKAIGKAKYRVLAKNVIFGLMYGRGARAIAMQARMEGVRDVTVEVAETIVATVFDLYPRLEPFFAACRARVTDPGWLANPFGGLRRFPTARAERSQLAEFERQAMNFPIQSSVADMVDRAVAHLDRSIAEHELGRDVRLLLSIHDAVLLECRPHLAGWVGGTLLPFCMKDAVPLVPADLDGRPTGAAPYHLDIDVEVMERWGVPLSAARAAELGVDPGVAH